LTGEDRQFDAPATVAAPLARRDVPAARNGFRMCTSRIVIGA